MGILLWVVVALIIFLVYVMVRHPSFETGLTVLTCLMVLVYLWEALDVPAVLFQRLR